MKSQFLFLLSFILTYCLSYGQFVGTSYEDAVKLKKCIMVIQIEEEDAELVKTMKPDELEEYKSQVQAKNEILKWAVEEYWNFTDSFQIRTAKERYQQSQENPGKFATLWYSEKVGHMYSGTGEGKMPGKVGWSRQPNGDFSYNPRTREWIATHVVTTLSFYSGPGCGIEVNFPNKYPSKSDVVFALQQMQYVLKTLHNKEASGIRSIYVNKPANYINELKQKTLAVEKRLLREISEEEIRKIYPYPIKLVEYEEFEKTVLSKDSQYVYLELIPMDLNGGAANGVMISAVEDGRILYFDFPKVMMAGVKYNMKLDEKQFKKLGDSVEKSVTK